MHIDSNTQDRYEVHHCHHLDHLYQLEQQT
jgi:hypothetical protein